MLHIPPTNLLLLAAKQEPYKMPISLRKILKNALYIVKSGAILGGTVAVMWRSRYRAFVLLSRLTLSLSIKGANLSWPASTA